MLYCCLITIIWAATRENLSSGFCEQQRPRPACASAQSDQRLGYSFIGKYHIKTFSSGAIKTVCDMQIEGKHGPGWPKMTWKTLTVRDCPEWKLNGIDPCDRDVWRSSVRSAMHAASQ